MSSNPHERGTDSPSRLRRAVEDGETYDHAEHGRVEVTGIWHRTQRLDAVYDGDERDTIVVRYAFGENGEWIDELAEPMDDFLDAIP